MPSIADLEKSMTSAVDAALKQHKNTKQAVISFKEKLSALVSILSENEQLGLPLFIFVDELDRCRPDYAIELLEGIKHLFGVPGVYFIVATNMQQLGESTKAIYG
ncbi:P-loop NTPase fold protein [Janthinobacterium lividum]|uniref:P-loop NTPase fold protein n=1 Tax=Janthinobacterium lividum TaxID=29581 RepID=UPI0009B803DA|nr:P-loop NTPase fold protein [Janthinobacterium lividum]